MKKLLILFIFAIFLFGVTQQTLASNIPINWKTYENAAYTVGYPPAWYVYEYGEIIGYSGKYCVALSDIPNPQDISFRVPIDSHQFIGICVFDGPIPYSSNSTSITVNGYSGYRSDFAFPNIGLGEMVNLSNPNGGHILIARQIGDPNIYNQILSTITLKNWNTNAISNNIIPSFLVSRLIIIGSFSAIFLGLSYYIVSKMKFNFGRFLLGLLIISILFTFFARWEGGWLAAAIDLSLKLVLAIDFIVFLLLKVRKKRKV